MHYLLFCVLWRLQLRLKGNLDTLALCKQSGIGCIDTPRENTLNSGRMHVKVQRATLTNDCDSTIAELHRLVDRCKHSTPKKAPATDGVADLAGASSEDAAKRNESTKELLLSEWNKTVDVMREGLSASVTAPSGATTAFSASTSAFSAVKASAASHAASPAKAAKAKAETQSTAQWTARAPLKAKGKAKGKARAPAKAKAPVPPVPPVPVATAAAIQENAPPSGKGKAGGKKGVAAVVAVAAPSTRNTRSKSAAAARAPQRRMHQSASSE